MATGLSGVAELNGYFNSIYEDAVFVARANNIMSSLCTTFNDSQGDEVRKLSAYPQITAQSVGETDDFAYPTKFDKTNLSTLTPAEYMAQGLLTDRRIETDPQNARQDLSIELGNAIADNIETNMLSTFSSLTGGTISSSGTAITWSNLFAARSLLKGSKVPGPYVAVLSEYQWHSLAKAVAPGQSVTQGQVVSDDVARQWYVGSVGDIDIYTTANIAAGTSVFGAIYNRAAIGFDSRRAPRLEPERDASKRAWELNISVKYGYGVWRPGFGVAINTAGTAPTG
jgi:hypothetical protein